MDIISFIMTIRKTLDGLNYKEAQRRNSTNFNYLSAEKKKEIRGKGYKNVGWKNVKLSWLILSDFLSKNKAINLSNFAIEKAKKNYQKVKDKGDLVEILDSGKSLIQALKMKYQ